MLYILVLQPFLRKCLNFSVMSFHFCNISQTPYPALYVQEAWPYTVDAQYILISSMNLMLKSCTVILKKEKSFSKCSEKVLFLMTYVQFNDLSPKRNKAFYLELTKTAFSPSPKEAFITIANDY